MAGGGGAGGGGAGGGGGRPPAREDLAQRLTVKEVNEALESRCAKARRTGLLTSRGGRLLT